MDKFSFFFAFYGLILGLAVAELLIGLARLIRARAVRQIEARTALMALFIFVSICATWIDAFQLLDYATLDFQGLAAPVLAATCYFLAATVVFPTDAEELSDLGRYFTEHKTFIVGLLFAAEWLITYTLLPAMAERIEKDPAFLWYWLLPYNLLTKGTYIALLLARRRNLIIALEIALLFLFLVPYWSAGALPRFLANTFG